MSGSTAPGDAGRVRLLPCPPQLPGRRNPAPPRAASQGQARPVLLSKAPSEALRASRGAQVRTDTCLVEAALPL